MGFSQRELRLIKDLSEKTTKISGEDASNMMSGLFTQSELDEMYTTIKVRKAELHEHINCLGRWSTQHINWIEEGKRSYGTTFAINQRKISLIPEVKAVQKKIVKKFKDDLDFDVTIQFWCNKETSYTVNPLYNPSQGIWARHIENHTMSGIGFSINGQRYKTLVEMAESKKEGRQWLETLRPEHKKLGELITKLEGLIGDDE